MVDESGRATLQSSIQKFLHPWPSLQGRARVQLWLWDATVMQINNNDK